MFFKNDNEKPGGGVRRTLPALPLRDIVVFPHMVSQLFVGREKSIAALDEAMGRDKEIFLAAQKNAKTNDPTPDDVYTFGGQAGANTALQPQPAGEWEHNNHDGPDGDFALLLARPA